MLLRTVSILLLAVVVAGSLPVAPAVAQSKPAGLGELWERYPLESPPAQERSVGAREESGSLAGPPPPPAKPAGPIPEAFLFVALALAVVGIAGGLRQGLVWFRRRRRDRTGRLGAGAGDLGR